MNEVVSLLAYFMVYAFIGWVLESTYNLFYKKELLIVVFCMDQFARYMVMVR